MSYQGESNLPGRGRKILGGADSLGVHRSDALFAQRVAQVSKLPVPLQLLDVVLLGAPTFAIGVGKVHHAVDATLLGRE